MEQYKGITTPTFLEIISRDDDSVTIDVQLQKMMILI